MKPLILASTSKYRRELLSRLRLPFEVQDPQVDETPHQKIFASPRIIAERLALEKANRVLERNPEAVVIGADQVAAYKGQILLKPGNAETALQQLRLLSGRTHELISAVAVVGDGRVLWHTEITRLTMEPLSEDALKRYLAVDEPFDCAGSYKIESLGIALFTSTEGSDITAIQGLPLMAISRLLREIGYQVP